MTRRPTLLALAGALGDVGAARAALDDALAAHDLTGDLVVARSPGELARRLARLPADAEPVVAPGADVDLADLLDPAGPPTSADPPGPGHLGRPAPGSVLRLDLGDRPRDPSPQVRRHLRGRGTGGIRYAVDAWFHHCTCPPTAVHRYGPDRDQHAELRLPTTGPGPAGHPVAVLVHGGYWRSRWESDLMEPLAVDLTARGWATWNVEYRRPDDHSWADTTADVAAALAALADVGAPLDLGRVVTLGHSAGGQLVTRLAADVAADVAAGRAVAVRPALTVSLAGVLDLVEGDRRRLGDGAVARALGGSRRRRPDVYRASSPAHRLPIGSPVAVVCGVQDDPHLLDLGRAFARAARAAGDDVRAHEGPGDHFAVIDPRSAIWPSVLGLLTAVRSG